MAGKTPDPLVESLMALAVSAAPLIERARAAGLFKAGSRAEAASETVVPPSRPASDDLAAQKAALQDIVVSQAMKIAALEAEVARLKGVSSPS